MARIPQNFIDDLVARVDIVELIDGRVPLKKAGREFTACCPFHNEKSPSFTVSPTKQFYHCFGCGAHGTAIGFLIEFDRLEFPDAVRALAEHAGVEVPIENNPADEQRRAVSRTLYEVLNQANDWYQKQLPTAPVAVEYLQKRGLSGTTARTFQIGYAPAGWDGLIKRLGNDAQTLEQLLTAGLIIEKEGDSDRVYDRFRDRVMFPIRDARGRVIGFGGRVMDNSTPKYLNSPETPVFHKGRELYGLYEAKQALRELPRLMVVEGYMDVIALAEQGIQYAVATLGTAVTPDHLQRLFRVTPELIFCFDGDQAGRKAAWRALEQSLPELRDGRQAKFLFLPDGEDPDSLVRKEGSEAFEERVAKADSLSRFLFDSLTAKIDVSNLDGRARLVDLAKPLIQPVPAGAFRELLLQELANRCRMDINRLEKTLGSNNRAPDARGSGASSRSRTRSRAPTAIGKALALVLQQPKLAAAIKNPGRLEALDLRGSGLLVELLETLQDHPELTTAALLERWRDRPEAPHLAQLTQDEIPGDLSQLQQMLDDLIKQFDARISDQRLEQLLQLSRMGELNPAGRAELKELLAK